MASTKTKPMVGVGLLVLLGISMGFFMGRATDFDNSHYLRNEYPLNTAGERTKDSTLGSPHFATSNDLSPTLAGTNREGNDEIYEPESTIVESNSSGSVEEQPSSRGTQELALTTKLHQPNGTLEEVSGSCRAYSEPRKIAKEIRTKERRTKAGIADCKARVLAGQNVLLEQMFEFAYKWDQTHHPGFFCDIFSDLFPRDFSKEWPVDFTIRKEDNFDLAEYQNLTGIKVFYFNRGVNYCRLLDYSIFTRYINYKVILIGPFGDRSNFGPFSGGPHSPYFKYRPFEAVFKTLCGSTATWESALKVLDHDNVVAWITFQQNLEHPKIISFPIGTGSYFQQYAMNSEGFTTSIQTQKDYLLGVTFEQGYADRPVWLDAVKNASIHALKEDQILYSQVHPFRNKSASKPLVWNLALETPRRSKIVLAPGGLGVDTKRPVEALLVGSVPMSIINTGLYKTYRNLPMIWTFTYNEFYALEYRLVSLLCSNKTFKFEKLTYSGWGEFVAGLKQGTMTIDDW